MSGTYQFRLAFQNRFLNRNFISIDSPKLSALHYKVLRLSKNLQEKKKNSVVIHSGNSFKTFIVCILGFNIVYFKQSVEILIDFCTHTKIEKHNKVQFPKFNYDIALQLLFA